MNHGFIPRSSVTPANIHDSQILAYVRDPENRGDFIRSDSGYAGVKFEQLLVLAGFESCIHDMGTRNHPLIEEV